MPEDRQDHYLAAIDTAADWTPIDAAAFAPSFDEWNAMRVIRGQAAGDFAEYLEEIDV